MAKIDFKKDMAELYSPSAGTVVTVEVPSLNFLMIDGRGNPNTSSIYSQALDALYAVAYALKFASKREQAIDYVVPPLEGLWWAENMQTFMEADKEIWEWTMMIMQPGFITARMVSTAIEETERKKAPPALHLVRSETYEEGLSVQTLHIGPYDAEGPTIERMHSFIADQGYVRSGKHHEIYLSDPRRTSSEKLKTVLRQPIRRE